MSFLLPQTRRATVQAARPVSIHGDRYVDVQLAVDEAAGTPLTGRVSASECPDGLAPGDRVEVRVVMGAIVGIVRRD